MRAMQIIEWGKPLETRKYPDPEAKGEDGTDHRDATPAVAVPCLCRRRAENDLQHQRLAELSPQCRSRSLTRLLRRVQRRSRPCSPTFCTPLCSSRRWLSLGWRLSRRVGGRRRFGRRLLDLRRLHMSARALRDLGIDPPQSVALGLRGFAELGSLPPIKAPLLPLRAGTERLSSLREDDGNSCNSGPHGCLLAMLNGSLVKHQTRGKFAQVSVILHQTKPSPTSQQNGHYARQVPDLS